jgi:hypothetical protein
MRVSVQARQPQSGERWRRSIYLDGEIRDVVIPFSGCFGGRGGLSIPRADALLFGVD